MLDFKMHLNQRLELTTASLNTALQSHYTMFLNLPTMYLLLKWTVGVGYY